MRYMLMRGAAALLIPMASKGAAVATVPVGAPSVALAGLVDQHGRAVVADRFAGKIVLLNFIFTGCGSTCPVQTAGLVRLDRSLPPAVRTRIRLVSVTVDPTNDTPARLARFAVALGVDGRRWSFLTGRPDRVARTMRTYVAFRPGDVAKSGFHTSDVRLFDGKGRMIQRYAGAPLAERQLRDDILTLTRSAS